MLSQCAATIGNFTVQETFPFAQYESTVPLHSYRVGLSHRITGCALLGLLSIESVSVDWSQDGLPREFTTLFAPSAPPLVTSTSAHVDPHWLIPCPEVFPEGFPFAFGIWIMDR